jgi:hypothetical protein
MYQISTLCLESRDYNWDSCSLGMVERRQEGLYLQRETEQVAVTDKEGWEGFDFEKAVGNFKVKFISGCSEYD